MAKTTVTAATKKKRKRSSSKTDATAAKEASVEKASVEKALVDRRSPSILAVAGKNRPLTFPHRYIMAPMVGASELAFRLLCRQYGTQCAYTPMMSAHKFATDAAYRAEEFQTCVADFPLVCHFESNNPQDFAAAARAAAPYCDAIDLNLGCPQRTAYLGHFGSYLLDAKDRDLICAIIQAGVAAVDLPIVCKIRLLETLEETIALCEQLQAAGASLIAIHARYRASWERKGAGARDGPALLEQVAAIRQRIQIPVITNGNTITYEDVVQNLASTKAHGLMSAEGILDNPALFLPQLGEPDASVKVPLVMPGEAMEQSSTAEEDGNVAHAKKKRKLAKKLREIGRLEEQVKKEQPMTDEEKQKLSTKVSIEKELASLVPTELETGPSKPVKPSKPISTAKEVSLRDLYARASDKVNLAQEYLALASLHPVKIRSVVFHTRRMLKDLLTQYQLLDTCLAADTIADVQKVLHRIEGYQKKPASFVFDIQKEKEEKEALERKRYEEGKRKAFEARMIRKAKREGREDLQYYLHRGTDVPSKTLIKDLQKLPREKALLVWKGKHSQHCLALHLDPKGCTRGKACSFLHVDVLTANTFNEQDEVAG